MLVDEESVSAITGRYSAIDRHRRASVQPLGRQIGAWLSPMSHTADYTCSCRCESSIDTNRPLPSPSAEFASHIPHGLSPHPTRQNQPNLHLEADNG